MTTTSGYPYYYPLHWEGTRISFSQVSDEAAKLLASLNIPVNPCSEGRYVDFPEGMKYANSEQGKHTYTLPSGTSFIISEGTDILEVVNK